MREIKFRVWDGKKMWLVADLQFAKGDKDFIATYGTDVGYLIRGVDAKGNKFVGTIPDGDVALLQCTGLKDKHGKDIYEGDILAIKFNGRYIERVYWKGEPDAIAEVYWDFNGFRLNCFGEKDRRYADFYDLVDNYEDEPQMVDMSRSHSEIIGNIYQNPELRK